MVLVRRIYGDISPEIEVTAMFSASYLKYEQRHG